MNCRRWSSKRLKTSDNNNNNNRAVKLDLIVLSAVCTLVAVQVTVLTSIRAHSQSETDALTRRIRTESSKDKQLVLIAVMTSKRFLSSRIPLIMNTWFKTAPGRTLFFSSQYSRADKQVPLVALPGVTDVYPPQKKSFLMFKHIYDNFIDDFEWFMRVDDDIYIKADKLEQLLRSIDSRQSFYIGQPGTGVEGEVGKIGLGKRDNFCMGGPGIIVSRQTLTKFAPHVHKCLKDLRSHHEDVEIGRCIKRFANVSCTWNYEMLHILYNHPNGTHGYSESLQSKDILHSVSLHPAKSKNAFDRVHNFVVGEWASLLHERKKNWLSNHSNDPSPKSFDDGFSNGTRRKTISVTRWSTFTARSQYSLASHDIPVRGTSLSNQHHLDWIVDRFMYIVNKRERELGRTVRFNKFLKAYDQQSCSKGVGLLTLTDLQIIVGRYKGAKSTKLMNKRINVVTPKATFLFIGILEENRLEKINFIVPVHGRSDNLLRLINNFIDVMLKTDRKSASLSIVSPVSEYFGTTIHKRLIEAKLMSINICILKIRAPFNRGRYRSIGAKQFAPTELLFFIDLDMIFGATLLSKIRLSTRLGSQVYVPIVYSQYDPDTWHFDVKRIKDSFYLNDDRGYWRIHGFGMVGAYKSDLDTIGDWDVNISGWGKEDVLIYEKFIASDYTVFRSPEPLLVHIFHQKECKHNLPTDQMIMCRGTQLLASRSESKLVRNLGNLLRMPISYNMNRSSVCVCERNNNKTLNG